MPQKRPSQEALLNAAVLRWMHDVSPQGILMTDADLNIAGWNQWLEHHTGRSASEIVGQNLLTAFPELVETGLHRYYKWALEGQVRVLSQRLHGHLLAMPAPVTANSPVEMQQSARISPLTYEGRVIGTLTIIEDVTERVMREAELQAQIEARSQLLASEKAAREEAERANRLKDDFLATVSHELRSPLTAMLGWANMLLTRELDEETRTKAIETINRNAQAQHQLISDLLDVSRIISGKLRLNIQMIELGPIIDAAMDSVRPAAAAKNIELESSIGGNVNLILADADRLQQVIWNLLTNAIKFTPKEGSVRLKAQKVESGELELTVTDSGIGISNELLPYVFDRFRQGDAATTKLHGGLGLGLSIVRQLMELHGGTVRVESEGADKGATFIVNMPISSVVTDKNGAPSGQISYPDSIGFRTRLEGLRALVVDDEQDTRDLLKTMLGHNGLEVLTASSAAEALLAFEEFRPHVLICDVGMPGEDGYSLISKVRSFPPEQGGRTPAIALTAYVRGVDRQRALNSGFEAHLAKPVNSTELLSVLTQLVENSRSAGRH
jgi:signal transduction histidine kinase/CheY-like chemotaxis protein